MMSLETNDEDYATLLIGSDLQSIRIKYDSLGAGFDFYKNLGSSSVSAKRRF
jgi:hypothetical protein